LNSIAEQYNIIAKSEAFYGPASIYKYRNIVKTQTTKQTPRMH